ncbi:MAG: bifunctional (p)ppGpp synthetase/guanosine-3',5'-bis(diphosphate) 3'-pyrophosphohydrolase [Pasteurella sp.]|nr:bifunctional (p)ppGpp synthetase/guanosine-3',5'-bis(diphosphate) 3'-pyrophosphohydrolase [Pasteurella sp.]
MNTYTFSRNTNSSSYPINIISKALSLSALAHRGQKRADGSDYIEHPIEVANNLISVGIINPEQLATAYLHDALEKGPTNMHSLIEYHLGVRILSLVEALTDDQTLSSSQRKVQQLERVAALPIIVKQIKLADRIANLRAPRPDWNEEKRQNYAIHSHKLLDLLKGSHHVLELQLKQRLELPVWNIL